MLRPWPRPPWCRDGTWAPSAAGARRGPAPSAASTRWGQRQSLGHVPISPRPSFHPPVSYFSCSTLLLSGKQRTLGALCSSVHPPHPSPCASQIARDFLKPTSPSFQQAKCDGDGLSSCRRCLRLGTACTYPKGPAVPSSSAAAAAAAALAEGGGLSGSQKRPRSKKAPSFSEDGGGESRRAVQAAKRHDGRGDGSRHEELAALLVSMSAASPRPEPATRPCD